MFGKGQSAELQFEATLALRECAGVFSDVGESFGGGLKGAMNRMGAKKRSHTETEGFYTPADDNPFAGLEEAPDFAVGLNTLGGSLWYGAGARMKSVEMFVYDQGASRLVTLVGYGGGAQASESLLEPFAQDFRAADS